VKGVVTEADVKAGKVQILAPEHFAEHAISKNVIAGNGMRQISLMGCITSGKAFTVRFSDVEYPVVVALRRRRRGPAAPSARLPSGGPDHRSIGRRASPDSPSDARRSVKVGGRMQACPFLEFAIVVGIDPARILSQSRVRFRSGQIVESGTA
jgi:hypothetical protein